MRSANSGISPHLRSSVSNSASSVVSAASTSAARLADINAAFARSPSTAIAAWNSAADSAVRRSVSTASNPARTLFLCERVPDSAARTAVFRVGSGVSSPPTISVRPASREPTASSSANPSETAIAVPPSRALASIVVKASTYGVMASGWSKNAMARPDSCEWASDTRLTSWPIASAST